MVLQAPSNPRNDRDYVARDMIHDKIMCKMNKGLDPANSMVTELSNKNYNNKWSFEKEKVLSQYVVWFNT